MALDNITIGYSPLTSKIYLYRFRKGNPGEAIEKRECDKELFTVLLESLLALEEKGMRVDIREGNKKHYIIHMKVEEVDNGESSEKAN